MKNIFVVYTPYHLYTIQKIIKTNDDNYLFIIDNNSRLQDSLILKKDMFNEIIVINDISKLEKKETYKIFNILYNIKKNIIRIGRVDKLHIFLDNNLIGQVFIKYVKKMYNSEVYLLEDGTGLYIKDDSLKKSKKLLIKKIIYKIFLLNSYKLINQGENEDVDFIYCNYPYLKNSNNNVKNIQELYIRDIHIDIFKNKKIDLLILTQPLSEDGFTKLYDEINLYKSIFKELQNRKIYLKLHPREKIEKYQFITEFENVSILENSNMPIEAIIENMNCNYIISISTSGILNIRKFKKIYIYPMLELKEKFDILLKQFENKEDLFIANDMVHLKSIIQQDYKDA